MSYRIQKVKTLLEPSKIYQHKEFVRFQIASWNSQSSSFHRWEAQDCTKFLDFPRVIWNRVKRGPQTSTVLVSLCLYYSLSCFPTSQLFSWCVHVRTFFLCLRQYDGSIPLSSLSLSLEVIFLNMWAWLFLPLCGMLLGLPDAMLVPSPLWVSTLTSLMDHHHKREKAYIKWKFCILSLAFCRQVGGTLATAS